VDGLVDRAKALEKQVKELKLVQAKGGTTAVNWTEVAGVPVFVQKLETTRPRNCGRWPTSIGRNSRAGSSSWRRRRRGSSPSSSPSRRTTRRRIRRELAKALGARLGGSGGGNPSMAQAGGTDVAKLNEALADLQVLLT